MRAMDSLPSRLHHVFFCGATTSPTREALVTRLSSPPARALLFFSPREGLSPAANSFFSPTAPARPRPRSSTRRGSRTNRQLIVRPGMIATFAMVSRVDVGQPLHR
jgi:hypothetical protein